MRVGGAFMVIMCLWPPKYMEYDSQAVNSEPQGCQQFLGGGGCCIEHIHLLAIQKGKVSAAKAAGK